MIYSLPSLTYMSGLTYRLFTVTLSFHLPSVSYGLVENNFYFDFNGFYSSEVLLSTNNTPFVEHQDQGPVVQSIVSSTSLLRGQLVKCFTTL